MDDTAFSVHNVSSLPDGSNTNMGPKIPGSWTSGYIGDFPPVVMNLKHGRPMFTRQFNKDFSGQIGGLLRKDPDYQQPFGKSTRPRRSPKKLQAHKPASPSHSMPKSQRFGITPGATEVEKYIWMQNGAPSWENRYSCRPRTRERRPLNGASRRIRKPKPVQSESAR